MVNLTPDATEGDREATAYKDAHRAILFQLGSTPIYMLLVHKPRSNNRNGAKRGATSDSDTDSCSKRCLKIINSSRKTLKVIDSNIESRGKLIPEHEEKIKAFRAKLEQMEAELEQISKAPIYRGGADEKKGA